MTHNGYSTRSIVIGAFWMVGCALELAILVALVKAASVRIPTGEILWFQNWIALLMVIPFVIKKGIKTDHPWLQLARAVGGAAALYFYFLALRFIPLVNAVLATNTAPLWVPLLVFLWLKTPIRALTWPGIILGFIGVGLILRPGFAGFHPAVLLAIWAGLLIGITFVIVQVLGKTDRPLLTVFYYFLLSTVVTTPLAIALWVTPNGWEWLLLIGTGIFHGVSALSMVTAMKHGPSHLLSPLYYFIVPASGLLDWIFWDHIPGWLFYVGAILVIGGGIWTIEAGRRAARPYTNPRR